ncbi:MAG: ribonuclease HII [Oscillospiraceae bacterium]
MKELTHPWEIEESCYAMGYAAVCGVDEAGAGPLAGPVYAAAVILPRGLLLPGLNDSKKLTEKQREKLFPLICEQAAAYAVATASEEEIDSLNILRARMLAMDRAIRALPMAADFALIDGNRSEGIACPNRTVVGGDGRSASIAAASVLAKVSRDRFVTEVLDRDYPQYGFAKHKGYGTKLHYEMLDRFGPCPAHRRSFLKKWEAGR